MRNSPRRNSVLTEKPKPADDWGPMPPRQDEPEGASPDPMRDAARWVWTTFGAWAVHACWSTAESVHRDDAEMPKSWPGPRWVTIPQEHLPALREHSGNDKRPQSRSALVPEVRGSINPMSLNELRKLAEGN